MGFLGRSVLLMRLDVFDLTSGFECNRVREAGWVAMRPVDGR